MGFCANPLDKPHVGTHVNDLGVVRLIIGILYALMAVLTVFWIHVQERNAQAGNSGAVKSVIFPIFTKMMWLSAFSSVLLALLMIFVPVHLTHGHNDILGEIAYPVGFTLQHAVMEGIAFLLMNKGCGVHAAKNTLKYVSLWCAFTFVVTFATFQEHAYGLLLFYIWDVMQLVFYFCLWLMPLNRLYRRPAAYPYACFWFWFRVMEITFYSLSFASSTLVANIGHCGYVFGPLLIFTLFQPIVCYQTLLLDSSWWQGLGSGDDNKSAPGSINSPMWGMDLTLHSAQTLARTLDEMRNTGSAKLVNFAHISLDTNNVIGQGSFSRVYTGTYRMQKCAIKLVYSLDLTADEINKVAAEATLLNNVKHKHVVHIYGVSVLPPSVCILLELCEYGSLSDVLRGSPNNVNKALSLSYLDKMYLAVGCARGLAALHSMGDTLVHRDIKSFNFLVDSQLNAKLADLELGMESENIDIDPETLLPNWAAPEVLLGEAYTQASDVYSLSLVLWEIVSGVIPYSDVKLSGIEMFNHIRCQSAELKVRMKIPNGFKDIGRVIEEGWHSECARRPSASKMVDQLTEIWRAYSIDKKVTNLTSEVYEEIAVVQPSDGNGGSNVPEEDQPKTQVIIGKSISQLLQSWYRTAEFKKHAQELISASQGLVQSGDSKDEAATPSGIRLTNPRLSGRVYVKDGSKRHVKNSSTKSENAGEESKDLKLNDEELQNTQLQSLYDAICEHPDWRSLKTDSHQPIVIITKAPPHSIMCATDSWCRLTGFKATHVFGHSLDEFVLMESVSSRDNSTTSDESNWQSLQTFYDDMGFLSRSKSRGLFSRTTSMTQYVSSGSITGGSVCDTELQYPYAHAVVRVNRASGVTSLPLSMHGFPVTTPDGSSDSTSSIGHANATRRRGRNFPTNTSDFCVVYMNELCRLDEMENNKDEEPSGRSRSQSQSRLSAELLQRNSTITDRFSIS